MQNVLSPVVDTGFTYSETCQPCIVVQPCNVHHVVPDRVLLGTETLLNMQHPVPYSNVPSVLQLSRKLCVMVLWRRAVWSVTRKNQYVSGGFWQWESTDKSQKKYFQHFFIFHIHVTLFFPSCFGLGHSVMFKERTCHLYCMPFSIMIFFCRL